MNIGFIGAGAIASHHEQAIGAEPQWQIVAVADPMRQRAQNLAAKHEARFYDDHRQMLQKHQLDVVAVLTPHSMHAHHAIDSMTAGAHVVIEKPTAITMDQLRDIAEAAGATGKLVRTCHTLRYEPTTIRARELVKQGRLGTPLAAHFNHSRIYFGPGRSPWSLRRELAGGGILINTGMHRLDAILQVMESPFGQVKARIGRPGPNADVEGDFSMYLEHHNAAVSTIHSNGNVLPSQNYVCFMGEKANLISTNGKLWIEKEGRRTEVDLPEVNGGYAQLWRDIADDVRSGSEKAATLSYGAHLVAVAISGYESARTGQLEKVPRW